MSVKIAKPGKMFQYLMKIIKPPIKIHCPGRWATIPMCFEIQLGKPYCKGLEELSLDGPKGLGTFFWPWRRAIL